VLYYLEQTYGIQRPGRYLRIRRADSTESPALADWPAAGVAQPAGDRTEEVPRPAGLEAEEHAEDLTEERHFDGAAAGDGGRPETHLDVELDIEFAADELDEPTATRNFGAGAEEEEEEEEDPDELLETFPRPGDPDTIREPRPIARDPDTLVERRPIGLASSSGEPDTILEMRPSGMSDRADPISEVRTSRFLRALSPAALVDDLALPDLELGGFDATPADGAAPLAGGGPTVADAPRPATSDPVRRESERRRYLRTLSDVDEPDPAAPVLGRIAIRRVARPGSEAGRPTASLGDLQRAIRRAHGRDGVGDLVVAGLRDHFGGCLDAGMLLVVREPVAIGWKGFVRGGDAGSIEAIAVPLDQPSALAGPYRDGRGTFGRLAEATLIDRRLWKAIGGPPPDEVLVAPIVLGGQTVCLLYAQGRGRPAAFAADAAALAEATSQAFERLLRAAQR
jgi:hypothetical protein